MCNYLDMGRTVDGKENLKSDSRSQEVAKTHTLIVLWTLSMQKGVTMENVCLEGEF